MSLIQKISEETTVVKFKSILEEETKLVLVYFTSKECTPCTRIFPKVQKLAVKYSDEMIVYQCDVDDCKDVATDENIYCLPTFRFYRNGLYLGQLFGSKEAKLKELIKKHTGK